MSAPKFCILLLILAQMATAVSQATALDSQNEAASAIDTAEDVMASAYQAVKVAEIAGATKRQLSGFSGLLKDAAELLAQAHNSFRVGDFDRAVQFANLASEMGKEVNATAVGLGEQTLGKPATQMWLTMVRSLFAVLAVVLASYLGWRVFTRLYYRRIRATRPEVASNES